MKQATLALFLLSGLLMLPNPARADAAAAEALFREGRKLMSEGKIQVACEKFAASQKLDPSSGTLLNLAECQFKEGKIATAWATFLSASTLARSQGNAGRAAEAQRRADELEPRLSRLSLRFAARPEGLIFKRDQITLEPAALDTPIPVDPGPHTLSASAPGHKEWSSRINVTSPGTTEIEVPALEKLKEAPAPAASSGAPSSAPSPSASPRATGTAPASAPPSQRSPAVGYVVGGLGVVLLGAGAYFGLGAMSDYKKAEELCPTHRGCPESARDPSEDASRNATLSTLTTGLGLAGVVGGVYLIFTSKKDSKEGALRLSPRVAPGFQGAALGGHF